MARGRYDMDEAKIARFVREGRGHGTGAAYLPWLTVRDVPSIGRSHRPKGRKTGRVHHLFSDLEFHWFLIFDWAEEVIDVREQFPLDREVTQEIAADMGVAHPVDRSTRTPMVMTTDFLLDTTSPGGATQLARAVKPADQLVNARVLEKLEIERRYWNTLGVDWGIATDRNLPAQIVKNLEWLQGSLELGDLIQPYSGFYAERAAALTSALEEYETLSLTEFCDAMDARLDLEPDTALLLTRHLLSTKQWRTDISIPILDSAVSVRRFGVPSKQSSRARA